MGTININRFFKTAPGYPQIAEGTGTTEERIPSGTGPTPAPTPGQSFSLPSPDATETGTTGSRIPNDTGTKALPTPGQSFGTPGSGRRGDTTTGSRTRSRVGREPTAQARPGPRTNGSGSNGRTTQRNCALLGRRLARALSRARRVSRTIRECRKIEVANHDGGNRPMNPLLGAAFLAVGVSFPSPGPGQAPIGAQQNTEITLPVSASSPHAAGRAFAADLYGTHSILRFDPRPNGAPTTTPTFGSGLVSTIRQRRDAAPWMM